MPYYPFSGLRDFIGLIVEHMFESLFEDFTFLLFALKKVHFGKWLGRMLSGDNWGTIETLFVAVL